MFRRLFWLGAIAGVGYAVWRWARQQNEAPGPAGDAGRLYTPPPAAPRPPPTTLAPSGGPATSEPAAAPAGPRRIPTRVHRGSPPSASARAEAPAAEQPTDTGLATSPAGVGAADASSPAIPDLADLVEADAEGAADASSPAIPDLADLVEADAEGDLANLVGDAVAGEGLVDLAPMVSPEAEAGAPLLDAPLTNINTADEDALVALPGIGPALARRIITYRSENGPFASIDQLEDIQGIGPRNIDEFRHLVTV